MIATNAAFHSAIRRAGRNPYFIVCSTGFSTRRRISGSIISPMTTAAAALLDEHEDMIAVIAARDVEAADRLARTHASRSSSKFKSFSARKRPA